MDYEAIYEKNKNIIYDNIDDEIIAKCYYLINDNLYKCFKYNYKGFGNIIFNLLYVEDREKYWNLLTEIIDNYKYFKKTIYYKKHHYESTIKSILLFDSTISAYSGEFECDEFEDSLCIAKLNNYLRDFNIYSSSFVINCVEITDFNHDLDHSIDQIDNIDYYNYFIKLLNSKNINYNLSFDEYETLLDGVNGFYDTYTYAANYFLFNHALQSLINYDYKEVTIDMFDLYKTNSNFVKEKRRKESKKSVSRINDLVGLSNIKRELFELSNFINYRKENNINDNFYLNMLFLGNPGTGKTTVAKYLAEEFCNMGIIENNTIKSVLATDLMGRYVGQTKDTCRKVFDDAEGGILFIDEAYLLYLDNRESKTTVYMDEALTELLKYMEDPSHIVIFAGYSEEMRGLYKANPGFKSRIYKEIEFNDYSSEELYTIVENDLNAKNMKINKSAKKLIINEFSKASKDKGFGNARYALNYSQKIMINHINNNSKNKVINIHDVIISDSSSKGMGFNI